MARKLKVFQTRLGFYDTVVAAPSQAAALRAWGVRQNLFASGEAARVEDEVTIAAAAAHPETPLRRAAGSNDAFSLQPTGLPEAPAAPKRNPSGAAKRRAAPKPRPAADRSELNAAEAALERLNEARKREEADFRAEADELEARRAKAQRAYVTAHKAAAAKVEKARAAYRKAGGAIEPRRS